MEDIGFNGTGSKFNTRFGSNSDITGKQLNDLSYGIQAGLPQPGVGYGQSISYTPGGALFNPETDPNVFGRYQYNADPPQFKCVVYVDPSGGEDKLKYYLKIARGVITATGTKFPFTQGTTGNGGSSTLPQDWIIPCQERMIFDVAIAPKDSRKEGLIADSTSAWMASNGKFLLDTEVAHYFVTASFLDYDDDQDWYSGDTLIKNHEPWISILPNTGTPKNSMFAQNTPTKLTYKVALGESLIESGDRGAFGNYPTMLGYGMKVIARIDWKPDLKMWEVRQEMLGPISIEIPFYSQTDASEGVWPGTEQCNTIYQGYVTGKFVSTIENVNYLEKFTNQTLGDIYINPNEWWYDPKSF